jgi:hypothetical protein
MNLKGPGAPTPPATVKQCIMFWREANERLGFCIIEVDQGFPKHFESLVKVKK